MHVHRTLYQWLCRCVIGIRETFCGRAVTSLKWGCIARLAAVMNMEILIQRKMYLFAIFVATKTEVWVSVKLP